MDAPKTIEALREVFGALGKELAIYENLADRKPGYIQGYADALREMHTKLRMCLLTAGVEERALAAEAAAQKDQAK